MRTISQSAWLNGMSALVSKVAQFGVGANTCAQGLPFDHAADRGWQDRSAELTWPPRLLLHWLGRVRDQKHLPNIWHSALVDV